METFLQFLLQWHRLLPKTQLHGREGLFSVIEQLQGFEIAASAWERIILPSRVARYNPTWLDELCLNGEVAWGRLTPPASKNGPGKGSATRNNGDEPGRPRQATRNLPISLMAREDLGWLRTSSEELPFLSENAKTVLEALRRQGASFVSDLLTATRLLPTQVDEALWELVAAGLVTGDGFSAVRLLTDPNRTERAALSRRRRGWKRTPRARGSGRWTLLPQTPKIESEDPAPPVRARGMGALEDPSPSLPHRPPYEKEEHAEAWAWQLLQRYGILFRDLMGREEGAPPWYQLLPILRRLEQRGEVRGGRFVLDVGGEQYGLPEAVESLRHLKQHPPEPETVFLSAVDPLNLIGILTPGRRVTAQPSNAVAFHGGAFVGSREGKEIWISEKLQKETARQIERTLTSGRLLAPEEPGEEGEGEMEQIGLLTE